ncbi:MAG: hypothetical protein GY705_18930 [Bacteroidetes bacterium]|nr:hypothetical protein [Bacteroidota bacterium]
MTCHIENNQFDLAMDSLLKTDLMELLMLLSVLMNTAMRIEKSRYLQANPYERTEHRQSYANGYKGKE